MNLPLAREGWWRRPAPHRFSLEVLRKHSPRLILLAFLLVACSAPSHADIVLLLEEPINLLGHVTASGHSSLLLENLCSDDHIHMRLCKPGEAGSVVSRYEGIGTYDWLAMPLMPYLFAADATEPIPSTMTEQGLNQIREAYRAEHLATLAPSGRDGDWIKLVGASYRRRIIGVRMHTTPEQDLRLMIWLNTRRNKGRFNLFYANCADFTRNMLNVLYPGSVHRSFFFDAGITTPKQMVSGMHRYAQHHPELGWEVFVLAQVPGELPRSGKLYGVTEAFVRTKPYLLPLAILEPIGIGAVAFSGFSDHRYDIHQAMRAAPHLSSSDVARGDFDGDPATPASVARTGAGGN